MAKHGMYNSRIYKIWENMKTRCNNPNSPQFSDYGGRGIKLCEDWNEFMPFYNWAINNGYSESLTIDRIDNSLGFTAENCRWVDRFEQQRNTRPLQKNNLSGTKGVFWDNTNKKWVARIGYNNKSISLGHYDIKEDAINARKNAEKQYWKKEA